MSNWTIDGRPGPGLPIDDRAVQYGDGLFETIAIRDGGPRFWDLHLDRLARGCERLAIEVPDKRELRRWLDATVNRSGCDPKYAIAKIIVTAGEGPRGYRRPRKMAPRIVIGAFVSRPWPAAAYESGIRVRVCQTRLALQPQLAGIKSLNRLEQVLAQSEWRDKEFAEGLMLDTAGRIICGTMSNVFLLVDNRVTTPAITRCGVSGVMRRKVVELLEGLEIDFDVRDVDAAELEHASEVFLSNSQFGVLPVTRCDRFEWPVGDRARRVMRALADAGVPECRV